MKTKDKAVLVTGCSSGIGYCVAKGLKASGYQVFATARKTGDVARLRSEGLDAAVLDLDDSASVNSAVEEILAHTGGRLYGLFNNAGNVFGTIELTNRILPVMRRQGYGRIIQNSSLLGFVSLAYRGAYNASKYALEGLYDTLRLELAGTGIHAILIEPGPIESRFRANAYAMYRHSIAAEASVHREIYRRLEQRLSAEGPVVPFTLPPEAVLRKVLRALDSPRPKARYYVTFPTYLLGTLKRLLPTRTLDRVLLGISGGR
jgi:NAD(P)-dependent dehydrogenase (short-subunit alcohol dehydrogenase family)